MNKKLECIKRLLSLNNYYTEICEWFIELGITSIQEVNLNSREDERAEFILNILNKESQGVGCKFQLVSFEWQILPIELIKITCITDNDIRYFSHGH